AAHAGEVKVVGDDGEHRDGPESLDVAAMEHPAKLLPSRRAPVGSGG
ncbi:MAG: hypothetical protein RL330_752, partial [Actinomycetota bacterium]